MRSLIPILLFALVACQAIEPEEEEVIDIRTLIIQGEISEGLRAAREAHLADPDDATAREIYRQASIAALLERGRKLSLADRDVEALADFDAALELDPECVQVDMWRRRTTRKLSDGWYRQAREMHAEGRLVEAGEAYELALDYDRENMLALEDLYRVGVQLGYREGLSDKYYNEGITALRAAKLFVAGSRFDYSQKYRENNVRAERRRGEVDTELSRFFTERGIQLEEDGYFAAARTEYRMAGYLDEGNEEARAGFDRTTVEAEAHELYRSGEMWLHRGEWDEAEIALRQGLKLTKVQVERFHALIDTIDDRRIQAAYENALTFEHDFRYREAIVGYRRILEERQYYEDTRTRLSDLERTVAQVEELYASLATLGSPEEELETLRAIDLLWPEYEDVQARIDALEGDGE